ncbi:uncharacterized protein LOC126823591 [Patella vulgata]|uniref:uncharacterized protein LOC126823591 n=1 Tax=Patella vulgata TaxID=6465 RepID=UPI00217FEC68|nr:uncharacterized protein LOC126823591 [Patella vulgata]
MNGASDTVKVGHIKREPVDVLDTAAADARNDDMKSYRQHLIGPFTVNDTSFHDDREKYQQGETSRLSDSDVLTVRTTSRDGAESVTSHESDKQTFPDDMTGEMKYECHICFAKFRSARAFRGHINAHRYSSDGQAAAFLPCSPFTGQFSPKSDQQNGTFKCDGCAKIFYSRDTYAMHMMLRAKNENCSLAKSTLSQLTCDVKEEKNERVKMNIEAILSSFGHSAWNTTMDMHKMTIRKAFEYRNLPQESTRQLTPTSDALACTVCGEVMHSKDSLAMHMLFHARGDGEDDGQRNLLPMPPLASTTMRDYVNALALAGNKMQTARNLAAFHHAAINLTNENMAKFDARSTEVRTPSKPIYEPVALVKRMEWSENENNKESTGRDSHGRSSSPSPVQSPKSSPIRHQLLQNEPNHTPLSVCSSEIDESRSDMGDVASHYSDAGLDNHERNNERRPKSLDSGIKATKLAEKKYHGKYKNYQRIKMYHLLRKYSKQNLVRRQHLNQEQKKGEQSSASKSEGEPLAMDKGSEVPKEILAAHGASSYCQYCKIIYLDKTLYQLHMGLHNVNNPWQCNACGKVCVNRLEFSSHVLHY